MADKKNSHFIPGIYNYCDRWCERCPFTHRCRNFSMHLEEELNLPDHEAESTHEPLWQQQLEQASEAPVEEWTDISDVENEEPDEPDFESGPTFEPELNTEFSEEEMAEAEREVERRRHRARKLGGQTIQSSEAYSWRLRQFIEAHPELFREPPDGVDPTAITAAGGDADAESSAVWLQDALEVIQWHQFFITVKLMRAFHSLVSEEEFPQDWPRDSDGTAKVALIGIDRCIAAWVVVRDMLPAFRPEAVDFILRLKRLSTKVEARFPNARAFVRPGFDER